MDANKVLNWKFPEIEHAYTEKDTILYAVRPGQVARVDEWKNLIVTMEK